MVHRVALISDTVALSQPQPKLQDGSRASVSHGVPIYYPSLRQYQIIVLGNRGKCV